HSFPTRRSSDLIYSYRLMQEMVFPGSQTPVWMGVQHGEDVTYLFEPQLLKQALPANYKLAQSMIQKWTSFARTGIPSVSWKQAVDRSGNDFATRYLRLQTGHLKMVE